MIAIPSNSYYLIDIDMNLSSNTSYCSNILINKDLYHIPVQCHSHLLCNPYHCDDKSFRCMKIRETLCCLYKYIQENCSKDKFKDHFRSIYFHISIQHGYCEINLERIEQNDQSYCIANHPEPTTMSVSRLSKKYIHRYRHHLTTRLTQTKNLSSKSSFIQTNLIVLLLSMLF
jgi:hypothetical protein